MTRRSASLVLAGLLAAAAPASAQQAVQAQPWEMAKPFERVVDQACRTQAVKRLARDVEGLGDVTFAKPAIWQSSLPDLTMVSYNGVVFGSQSGDVGGHVLCTIRRSQADIAELAFEFEGAGLGGFFAFAGKPRSESRRRWTVFFTNIPYAGEP